MEIWGYVGMKRKTLVMGGIEINRSGQLEADNNKTQINNIDTKKNKCKTTRIVKKKGATIDEECIKHL